MLFASRLAGRVEHLVLFCTYVDGALLAESPLTKASRSIITQSWDFYSEVVARLLLGWSENEAAERFARLVYECTTPEMAYLALTETASWNIIELLSEVRSPSLVVHRRELSIGEFDAARTLAAGIPDAQLAVLEGTSVAPYLGDMDAVVNEMNAFLGDGPGPAERVGDAAPGALRTILFTDVEGSSALNQRLGDAAARVVMREHEQIVREELGRHGGEEVKTMGDGFMTSFGSAIGAVECAIALQRRFAEFNRSADHPVLIRVGMSAGEPIAEDDDLFGEVVNAAARIGAQANGGEILVADVVRQLVAGKGFTFNDRGEATLRGFDEPYRIFEVSWAE